MGDMTDSGLFLVIGQIVVCFYRQTGKVCLIGGQLPGQLALKITEEEYILQNYEFITISPDWHNDQFYYIFKLQYFKKMLKIPSNLRKY